MQEIGATRGYPVLVRCGGRPSFARQLGRHAGWRNESRSRERFGMWQSRAAKEMRQCAESAFRVKCPKCACAPDVYAECANGEFGQCVSNAPNARVRQACAPMRRMRQWRMRTFLVRRKCGKKCAFSESASGGGERERDGYCQPFGVRYGSTQVHG